MATPTVRMLSSGTGRGPSTTHQKNVQGNAAGVLYDIPANSSDLHVLSANGWSRVGQVGVTASRPTNAAAGDWYIDTSLSKAIMFDGVGWRDPVTGSTI